MVRENLQILLELYYRLAHALSSILDRGSVRFALVAAILTNVVLGLVLASGTSRVSLPPDSPGAISQQPVEDSGYPQVPSVNPARRLVQPYLFSPLSGVTVLVPVALFFVPAAVIIVALWDGLGGAGVVV